MVIHIRWKDLQFKDFYLHLLNYNHLILAVLLIFLFHSVFYSEHLGVCSAKAKTCSYSDFHPALSFGLFQQFLIVKTFIFID